jgi:ribonuclease-3
MPADYEELEARIGYKFVDRDLLLRALTHKSVHSEVIAGGPPDPDNEKLEFLGDSILGFVASEYLFRRCPQSSEGTLSRLKAQRVSSAHLFKVSSKLVIGEYLKLGRGEDQSGGRAKRAILANALEALIAAIFLDGGLGPSRSFVERLILSPDEPCDFGDDVALDAKSALQEFAQARKLLVPRYQIVHETGPEHAKLFTVEARVGRQFAARAEGASKKTAGLQAAALLLARLRSIPEVEALSRAGQVRASLRTDLPADPSGNQSPEAP